MSERPTPYVTSRIHCASCGEDLEIIYSAPTPGTPADYFAALEIGVAGTPIDPDTTTCPHCGGYIGDHAGVGDGPTPPTRSLDETMTITEAMELVARGLDDLIEQELGELAARGTGEDLLAERARLDARRAAILAELWTKLERD
jgi:hypothetical protein